MRVEWDPIQFSRTVNEMARVQRTTQRKVLERAARNVVEECIGMTPPIPGRRGFGKGQVGTNVRTKTGKNAVARDIRKVFLPASELRVARKRKDRVGRFLNMYLERGENDKARTILRGIGFHRLDSIRNEVDPAFHEQQRNDSGRIPRKGARQHIILNQPKTKINAYIKERQKEVWKGASGWNLPATKLKVRGRYWPAAMRKHSQPGAFRTSNRDSLDVWFYVGNLSKYMQHAGWGLKIVPRALAATSGKMLKDLEFQLQLAHAKATT